MTKTSVIFYVSAVDKFKGYKDPKLLPAEAKKQYEHLKDYRHGKDKHNAASTA